MNYQDAPKTSSLFVAMTLEQAMAFIQVIACLDVLQPINCLEGKIIIIHVKYNHSIFDGKMTNQSSYTLPCEMHHIWLVVHVGLKMLLHLL